MSEPQDATIEEDERTDTDSSEVETDTVSFYHKTDLKRKRSLELSALGLSQADSHQRKRFRSNLTSRRDFFNLPREIRNQIYAHLNFLPGENEHVNSYTIGDIYSARNLAQTCRQAKAEYDEELALRLWNHLKHLEALYLSAEGYQLTFFRNLASSRDLVGLKSIKAIIRGPFPESSTLSLIPLLKLPVRELTIHYTGRYDAPKLLEVRTLFDAMQDSFVYQKGGPRPQVITLSWNWQEEKRDITLIERTFETSRLDPKNGKRCCGPCAAAARRPKALLDEYLLIEKCLTHRPKECLMLLPIGVNATWPSLKVGLSGNMEVGYCTLKRSSDHYQVEEAEVALMSAFIDFRSRDLDSMRSRCIASVRSRCKGVVKVKTFETEIKYKVGEDE
jgi:hypothetical protein